MPDRHRTDRTMASFIFHLWTLFCKRYVIVTKTGAISSRQSNSFEGFSFIWLKHWPYKLLFLTRNSAIAAHQLYWPQKKSTTTAKIMKLKNPQLIFLSSCAITSASTAEAVDTDGPAGKNKDCTFGSNYRYIQNYTAGEACPFDVSIGEQRINVTLDSNTT